MYVFFQFFALYLRLRKASRDGEEPTFKRSYHEQLLELAAYCSKLSGQQSAPQANLQAIGENFRRLAAVLEPHVKTNQAGTTWSQDQPSWKSR